MTTVFRADDLNSDDYTESLLAPPMATPISGDIVVRDKSYLADGDHGVWSGSWESEQGTSRWEFTDTGEVIEFCDPRIQQIKATIEELFGVDVQHHSLYFYGIKKNTLD